MHKPSLSKQAKVQMLLVRSYAGASPNFKVKSPSRPAQGWRGKAYTRHAVLLALASDGVLSLFAWPHSVRNTSLDEPRRSNRWQRLR